MFCVVKLAVLLAQRYSRNEACNWNCSPHSIFSFCLVPVQKTLQAISCLTIFNRLRDNIYLGSLLQLRLMKYTVKIALDCHAEEIIADTIMKQTEPLPSDCQWCTVSCVNDLHKFVIVPAVILKMGTMKWALCVFCIVWGMCIMC